MLRSQLTSVTATIAVMALAATACAGADGTERGAIRENVIEPGITAIDESRAAACGTEASSFRTALETYELLEGEPAADEAALIEAGLLRSESELWDIADGQLVAQDPACGNVATTVPTEEIITEESNAASGAAAVDAMYATFTADQVESYGGPACARQLAVVYAGADAYADREGVAPDTLADVGAAGYLSEPVTMWEVVGDSLRPTAGSECNDFVADIMLSVCTTEAETLVIAVEAYQTQHGETPTYEQLVDDGFVQDRPDEDILLDLVDGQPVAKPDGLCVGVDLTSTVGDTEPDTDG